MTTLCTFVYEWKKKKRKFYIFWKVENKYLIYWSASGVRNYIICFLSMKFKKNRYPKLSQNKWKENQSKPIHTHKISAAKFNEILVFSIKINLFFWNFRFPKYLYWCHCFVDSMAYISSHEKENSKIAPNILSPLVSMSYKSLGG